MRFVAVKTEEQQAVLALHRMRQQLVRFRVMQVNQLHGLLYEFGIVLPQGRCAGVAAAKVALAELASRLPSMLVDSLQDQLSRLLTLDEQIERYIDDREQPNTLDLEIMVEAKWVAHDHLQPDIQPVTAKFHDLIGARG